MKEPKNPIPSTPHSSRRNFTKTMTATAAGFMILPRNVLGGKNYTAPSDKVNIGLVGAGGQGQSNVRHLLQLDDVQITSVTDPGRYWDLHRFYYKSIAGREPVSEMIEKHNQEKGSGKKVRQYHRFHEMMEQDKDIDAIVCATPDHTHAYITIAALKAGLHVYCEKPMAHNIWETRMVRKVVQETGLATQMGNSGHSRDGMRSTVEYLQDGAIGTMREIHAWVPASRWTAGITGLPEDSSPLPYDFDWEEWLGPSPFRPYNDLFSPVTWRDFWIYGCGALGDFGCHDMDLPFWAFDLTSPSKIQIHPAGQSNSEIAPYGEAGTYHFPEKNGQAAMQLHWYSGGLKPAWNPHLPPDYKFGSRSAMYVGDKGVIITDGGDRQPQIFPESLREAYEAPPERIPRSNGHHRDWIDAIKNGGQSSANLDYGSQLTELTLLGVLSLRLNGQRIHWDAENMKAKGLPAADEMIKEPVANAKWDIDTLM
ncbi:Gfo/Idh/MocA family oxidoreductase [Membranicola marinus]|uniref:Gfo/Idh/MocA family oxidoreductase n=1 Tax=Membranihabitans marinus TaxID=1227546 RepID=A0A953HQX3_9BACT|nr:Gfo/Idh/MocA family oxidoreductase [Membranihabitans marinus]MBY5960127.1 Gfo/Idh/MocA family oxidoreductase [Membranihabitans marinus]